MDIVEILTMSKNTTNNNHSIMSIEDSSSYPDGHDIDDDDLELGLSIGGGLRTKEEASRMLTSQDFFNLKPSSSCSSSSSSIDGVHSVSPPNATSVVGWPPIRKAHRATILANRIKSEYHEEFRSRLKTNIKGHHLSVKVNMDETLIGRKVDLYAHNSYETLAQTLEKMFCEKWSSTGAVGSCSRLLNETSEFVLTYEDKDGDCMLVGDVPWRMFLSSVKRLRILRNPKMQQH